MFGSRLKRAAMALCLVALTTSVAHFVFATYESHPNGSNPEAYGGTEDTPYAGTNYWKSFNFSYPALTLHYKMNIESRVWQNGFCSDRAKAVCEGGCTGPGQDVWVFGAAPPWPDWAWNTARHKYWKTVGSSANKFFTAAVYQIYANNISFKGEGSTNECPAANTIEF